MDNYVLSITLDRGEGGIANSLCTYSKALDLIGLEHKVLLPTGATVIKQLQKIGNTDILTYPPALLKFLLLSRLLFSRRLDLLLNKASVVFLHNSKLLHYRLFPEKSFVICHSGKTRNLTMARNVIFLTRAAQKRFQQEQAQASDDITQFVVPHGFICNQGSHQERASNTIKIVSAGRFVEKKRFTDLIAAASILDRQQINYELNIYGSGPLEDQLKAQIKKLKLARVAILPWSNKLAEVFEQSDIFCLPSEYEPFGLVLGEAMLKALPVVATNTDGPLEILNSDKPEQCGGFIYECGNVELLASTLITLCHDKALRQRTGQNARKNIRENFSLEVMAAKLGEAIGSAEQLDTF